MNQNTTNCFKRLGDNMEKNEFFDVSDKKTIIICLDITVAIFVIDLLIPVGVSTGIPYILVILISLWSDRKVLPYYMAIGVSTLTIIGFFLSPSGGELWKALINRFLVLFAIWTVAILSVQRKIIYEQKEKALLEIKVLRGFLPICSSCKKIRDDRGFWNRIESYISDHSEAKFSHGICPECAKKLYPELDLYAENVNT
jgi:hypothetical protein